MKTEQQHDTIYTPYCYLIGWKKHNKFYYGVRYATQYKCLYESGCHPDDFWVTYTTSSKFVKAFREKYGEPDIMQIRKTFDCKVKATEWEKKVIRRLNAVQDSRFFNKNMAGAIMWDDELKAKVTGRVGARKGRTMQEMQPGWVNPLKGKTRDEIHGIGNWQCYRSGKTVREIFGENYIDPRSEEFTIRSDKQGDLYFNNVAECIEKTGLDGVAILQLKRGRVRKISRRKTTVHVFEDGDVIECI